MADNQFSEQFDETIRQEIRLDSFITEKQDEALRAIAELHNAIEELYVLRKGTKAGLLALEDFITAVQDKFIKVDVEGLGRRKDEIVEALNNISWNVRDVISKIEKLNQDISKHKG